MEGHRFVVGPCADAKQLRNGPQASGSGLRSERGAGMRDAERCLTRFFTEQDPISGISPTARAQKVQQSFLLAKHVHAKICHRAPCSMNSLLYLPKHDCQPPSNVGVDMIAPILGIVRIRVAEWSRL